MFDVQNKTLPFKVGDSVTGLVLADLLEEVGEEALYREEVVKEIQDEGNGFFRIKTDYTESLAKEIEAENATKEKEEDKEETDWFIQHDAKPISVIRNLDDINLDDLDVEINQRTGIIEMENIDIPIKMLEPLRAFVESLEDKNIADAFDVDEEISITIGGFEFKPSVLKKLIM